MITQGNLRQINERLSEGFEEAHDFAGWIAVTGEISEGIEEEEEEVRRR